MKVDQSSDVEFAGLKMAGASAASTSSPKVSMFGKKSGFVIPKNKLSGSLVPIFRGNKKLGDGDTASEESGKPGQRKTKWGPDLTQDAAVRRARALAYQTRVDQITKQLGSGMEIDENLESLSADEQPGERLSNHVLDRESTKFLELEKREAIGEILKLNASFKAPPDYKPLLKEDRVLIPVKEYPGYNFIALIFGPGGDNRKRLEKETGAKIQVSALKSGMRDKGEIISADGNDFQGSYEEIIVHISADTYEKVDAAVSVIELLVTSVSGNLAAASTTSASSRAESKNVPSYLNSSSADAVPVTSQGHLEDFMGPQQTPQQFQFQYSSPWFANAPPNTPANQFPGFIPSPNASAPSLNNPGQQIPSLFSPRPAPPAAFNSSSQSPLIPPRQSSSSQYMQNSVVMHPSGIGPPPRTFPSYPQASSLTPPGHSAPIPFSGSQTSQTRPPAIPSYPQLTANAAGPQSDRPLLTAGGPSNMMQVGPPPAPTSINLQPNIASSAPITNASAGSTSMIAGSAYSSGQSSLHSMAVSGSRPAGVPMFASIPPRMPIQSANSTQGAFVPRATMNPFPGSLPSPSPVPSGSPAPSFQSAPNTFTGNVPNFTPIRSPANAAPGPHRPNFGDFTFQPQQLQASHTFSGPGVQTHVPQPTSFRPPMHDPQPITARPQGGPSPIPFPGDPLRFRSFSVMVPTPVPQMGPRNMNPAAQLPDFAGSFPSRPGNPIEVQRTFHGQMNQPPRHHFIHGPSAFPGRPVLGPGGRQTYDPFSPTIAYNAPHQHGGNPAVGKRQESDPEYEDLMASVGVK